MYELIITEKPNASKKVAEALADNKPLKKDFKKVPYYELTHKGKKVVVGCAVGHLYGLAEREKSKGFSYPVFDIEWVPVHHSSKSAAFSKKYLDTLKKLCKGADVITVATDYDVEGEVIGLNVVRYACNRDDARRMKFSTLTRDDLVEAYERASPHLDWGQAKAGETRHFLDFYYGINLSRALTSAIKAAGMFKILSTGRVQGPALKIVADREKEISAFKPVPFWQVELQALKVKELITAWHEADKFWEKKKADDVMRNVKGKNEARVDDVSRKKMKQRPPMPFDLTSLQTEAYRLFNISPKQALQLAQDLYTNGYISYPRTSSQQLPDKIGFKKILNALSKQAKYKEFVSILLKKPKLVPNNGKKTDPAHPAIYPTGIAPKKMDAKAAKIYDLIVKRFFATFGKDAVRETMKVVLDVNTELFIAKGTRTVEPNWHILYAPYVKLEELELPDVKVNETLKVKKIELHEDKTKPPKRFTPASLIKMLEKKGLGTKATRADIVETLKRRQYIQGAPIEVTDLGMKIAKVLEKHSPRILDEKLTRRFEEDMEKVREGKKKEEQVLKEARVLLKDLLADFRKQETVVGDELRKTYTETRAALTTVGKCPHCGGSLVIRRGKFGKFIACDNYPKCKTTYKLPGSGMFEVIGKKCPACNFPMLKVIRKGKRPQEVCINPDCPEKAVKDVKEKPCKKCGKGTMVLRKSVYGAFLACNRYPKCKNIESISNGKDKK